MSPPPSSPIPAPVGPGSLSGPVRVTSHLEKRTDERGDRRKRRGRDGQTDEADPAADETVGPEGRTASGGHEIDVLV